MKTSSSHYSRSSALFSVTFDYDETDDSCLESLEAIKSLFGEEDLFISMDFGNTLQDTIASEVSVIMVYVAIIVIVVLILDLPDLW